MPRWRRRPTLRQRTPLDHPTGLRALDVEELMLVCAILDEVRAEWSNDAVNAYVERVKRRLADPYRRPRRPQPDPMT